MDELRAILNGTNVPGDNVVLDPSALKKGQFTVVDRIISTCSIRNATNTVPCM